MTSHSTSIYGVAGHRVPVFDSATHVEAHAASHPSRGDVVAAVVEQAIRAQTARMGDGQSTCFDGVISAPHLLN